MRFSSTAVQQRGQSSIGGSVRARLPLSAPPSRPATRVICRAAGDQKEGGAGGRQPWDFGRFVSTVAFFNENALQKTLQGMVNGLASVISQKKDAGSQGPTLSPVSLSPLASSATVVTEKGEGAMNPVIPVSLEGIIMVTGATGGVGKRVVGKLLQAGKHVRALVRDVPKANQLLANLPAAPGGKLELVAADITQARTLLPEYFNGVRAVVSCTAVKIVPKEGDDVDRSKYMQGIKFYDPEVVGDTPQSVELVGIKNLLAALGDNVGREQGVPLLKGDGSGSIWGPLDDVVMGGVSISKIQSVPGGGENGSPAMVFSGTVSTDNSGGFASVRCRNFEPPLDLGAYEGVQLRLKGDGQRYKCIIRPESNWDGIAMCHSFDTVQGEWQTISIPFSSFFPVFRARTLKGPDAKPLDPSKISSVQIMLSKFEYDGNLNPSFRKGDFSLPIASITSYLPDAKHPSPRIVHVSSAGVTRPNRPGINVDQEPPAVKLNASLGGLLDFKLAGEDALRSSGIPVAIVRPTALTEEPRGMPLQIDQGDTIKGKVGRDDVAELCVALLSEPQAAGVTFEIKSTVPFSQPWQVDPSAPPPVRDWSKELASASLVPGVTGKTVNGVYTGKQVEKEVAEKRELVGSS